MQSAGFSDYQGDLTTTAVVLETAKSLVQEWNAYLALVCKPADLAKYSEKRQLFVNWANAENVNKKFAVQMSLFGVLV